MDNNNFDFGNNNKNKNDKSNFEEYLKNNSSKLVKALLIGGGIVLVAIILFNSFFYVVDEREQAIVTQFNKIVQVVVEEKDDEMIELIKANPKIGDAKIIQDKGLRFKIPFIQNVMKFTDMLLTYDTNPREVISLDKKQLVLDNFAQWRIVNPALFYISLKNEAGAHTRLDDIIYSKLNENIGQVNAIKIIADKEYVNEMLAKIKEETNEQLKTVGIEVADIRIKRTELPEENYQNVYNRMETERDRAATEYRSEGREQAQVIRSEADKNATIIEAQAYEEAEKIKGEGDAEALKIYAEAYNQDTEFYSFWRSLKAYEKSLDGKTTIVLNKDTDFISYLYDIDVFDEEVTNEEETLVEDIISEEENETEESAEENQEEETTE